MAVEIQRLSGTLSEQLGDIFSQTVTFGSSFSEVYSMTVPDNYVLRNFRGIQNSPYPWRDGGVVEIQQDESQKNRFRVVDVEGSKAVARERIRNLKAGIEHGIESASEKRQLMRTIEELEKKLDLLSEVDKREQARKKAMEPSGRSIDLSEDENG